MNIYSRHSPFIASIKDRYLLNETDSFKETWHVSIDINHSDIKYDVGDCLGILPSNPPQVIEKMLEVFKSEGNELILTRHNENAESLRYILQKRINLSSISKKLVEIASQEYPDLLPLLDPENRKGFKEYIEDREVWDFLWEHPLKNSNAIDLLDTLQPLLPRLYSIASCQEVVGDEVHLTVSHVKYTSRGYQRWGTCTHYLCEAEPLQEWSVPIYLHQHKGFTLPEDPAQDIIMIGPGTGVAPYRGFMQKRAWRGDSGRSWLIFGERNRALDFFYQNEWAALEDQGKLKVTTAFSRDQPEKIYVQNRLLEHAIEVREWVENGAMIYVCGDAMHMAKDVENALIEILGSAEKVKELRHAKRYLKDVY
ncbi:MAG: sulfite reductase [Parachlamydiales bacterium]|jgi:sulfite reductase (NADPH) flavoprotein alpha-component